MFEVNDERPGFHEVRLGGFRFLRYKFYPWIALAIAPLHLLATADVDRT